MLSKSSKLFNLIRLGRATWLALFALAAMQLVFADHQFDHSAGTAAETCHVCAQADRLDDVVTDEAPTSLALNGTYVDATQVVVSWSDDTAYRNFDSRAPPKL